MDIKTIDEYILMEMREESPEVSKRAMKCATTEEYVVKKLVELEERVYDLENENETLKQENKALREAVKNCGKKITQVTKVLEGNLESKSNNEAEASTISMKKDFNDDDDDNDDDEFDINDIDYDDFDIDDLNYVDYGNSNYEDEED